MKKWVKILLIVLVSLILLYFIAKFIFIKYAFGDFDEVDIKFNETYHLTKVDAEDYFEMDGIKIRNDFKDYKLTDETVKYYKSEDGKIIKMFQENIYNFVDTSEEVEDSTFSSSIIEKLAISLNHFNNEIDIYKYAYDNKNTKITIFTSFKKLFGLALTYIGMPSGTITMVDGDYNGVVIKLNNGKFYAIQLYEKETEYIVWLGGENLNDEYVFDIINTIKID